MSGLRKSTADLEDAEFAKYARLVRLTLKKTTAPDIYASLVSEHRRKLLDLAIGLQIQPLEALHFQRALPRPAWVPRASWDVEKEWDLAAWVELEGDMKFRSIVGDALTILREEQEGFLNSAAADAS